MTTIDDQRRVPPPPPPAPVRRIDETRAADGAPVDAQQPQPAQQAHQTQRATQETVDATRQRSTGADRQRAAVAAVTQPSGAHGDATGARRGLQPQAQSARPAGSVSEHFDDARARAYMGSTAQMTRAQLDQASVDLVNPALSKDQQADAARRLGDDARRGNGLAMVALHQGYEKSQAKEAIVDEATRAAGAQGARDPSNDDVIAHNVKGIMQSASSSFDNARERVAGARKITESTGGLPAIPAQASTADLKRLAEQGGAKLRERGTLSPGGAEWARRIAQHKNANDDVRATLGEQVRGLKQPDVAQGFDAPGSASAQRREQRRAQVSELQSGLTSITDGRGASKKALDHLARTEKADALDGRYRAGSAAVDDKVEAHFAQDPAARRAAIDSAVDKANDADATALEKKRAFDTLEAQGAHLNARDVAALSQGRATQRTQDNEDRRRVMSSVLRNGSDMDARAAAGKRLLASEGTVQTGAVRDLRYEAASMPAPLTRLTGAEKAALADVAAARPRDFETRGGRLQSNMRAMFHTSPLDGVSAGPERARDGAAYLNSDDFRDRMKTTPTPEERSQIYQDTLSRTRSAGGPAAAQAAEANFKASNDKLATVMRDERATSAQRDAAARALAFAPKETLSGAQRDALVQYAKTSGGEAVRRGTLDQMKDDGPIGKAQLAQVGHEMQKQIGEAIKNAPEGSDLHRLGKLMRAQSLLANDPEMAQRARPGAREQLAGEIKKSLAGPAGQQIADIAARARKDAFGDRDLGKEQEAYLDSPAFKERLAVAGDDVKGEIVRQELTKLAAIDPERAQRVGDKLAREAVDDRVTDELRGIAGDDKGHKAVESAMTDVLKVGKGSAKVCKQIAKVMNEAAKDAKSVTDVANEVLPRIARQTQDLQNAMDAATKAGNAELAESIGEDLAASKEAKGILQKAHDRGLLGSLSAAVGMHSLATKGFKFGNTKDAAATGSTLASVASGTDDMLKMSSWIAKGAGATSAGEMAGKAAKFLGDSKVFKALGPIGDALGAVSEGANAYKEFQCGDTVGGACSTAASLGYGGAAALGLTALALGSNPIGWAALAAGLGAMAVSWAGNHFGESDEESFLYRGTNDSRGRPMRLIE